ncbi:MAG: glycosyltransferase family 39 protein [Gemmatimonadota bacterium]|nr:glycosyltransferase family 39 protein [Gemmatimonadota bacterium]
MVSRAESSSQCSDLRWIWACVVLGAALRLFRIGGQSLWIDELISIQMASWAHGTEFWQGLLRDIHGPFTSALLHGWLQLGKSEAWMRLLYAIPAVATIPVMAVLGRTLVDRSTGRAAAVVLAVSPFHVWYSQEIRNYSWAMLWVTAATLLFVRLRDREGGWGQWVTLALLLSAGVLTNFSVVFLVAALTVALCSERPFRVPLALRWLGVLAVVGLAFLPWFIDWFGRVGGERVFVDRPPPMGVPLREAAGLHPAALLFAIWSLVFGYSLGPTLTQLHLDRSLSTILPHAPALLAGAVAVGIGAVYGFRTLLRRDRCTLCAVLLLVPALLAVMLAVRGVKTFHPRYLVAAFPMLVVLLSAGWSAPGRVPKAASGLALLLAIVSLGNHYFDEDYAKEDSRAAAEWVLASEMPGDTIVVIYSFRPFRYYFADTASGKARLLHQHKRFLQTDEDLRSHVNDASRNGGRVWLVLSRWWDVAPENRIRSFFEERLRESERREFHGVKVTLYEEAPA